MRHIALIAFSFVYVATAKEVRVTHKVTFTISSGGNQLGRIVLGLFGEDAPKTVKNFISFASSQGFKGKSYRGTKFHRVIRNFMIQGGDVSSAQDGTGSMSIYGPSFPDENLQLKHSEPGILSMANRGPGTNGSQFFITVAKTQWLDGKHVVFGKVLSGIELVFSISEAPTKKGTQSPQTDIVISDSNVVPVDFMLHLNQ